jgi:hypothetical protein
MAERREEIGVLAAICIVLVLLGIVCLAASYFGWLPTL